MIMLTLFAYWMGKNDLFNPVFLCVAVFTVSVFAASYNIEIWHIDLSPVTVSLIVTSLISMILCGSLTRIMMESFKGTVSRKEMLRSFYVEDWKYLLVLLLGAVTVVIYVHDIMRIGRAHGFVSGSGISALIKLYRNVSHFSSEAEDKVSRTAYYSMELFRIAAYFMTYIGLSNVVAERSIKKSLKKNLRYFAVTVMFLVLILFTGARMQLLKMFIFIILVFFILSKKKKGWGMSIPITTLFKIIMCVVALLALFVILRSFVGRSTETDPIYYITMYAGGSVELLDLFIKKPLPPSNIWGKETFYAMYNFLGRNLHKPEWIYVFAKEFRHSHGVSVGNVYSALRCFYYDFGFFGCVLCSGIVGAAFTSIYTHIRFKRLKKPVDMTVLLYCYLGYSFCMFSINYYFDYLSFSFIRTLIFFFLMNWFLSDCKLKENIRFSRLRITS